MQNFDVIMVLPVHRSNYICRSVQNSCCAAGAVRRN
ncbi:hypothetical protein BRC2024_ULFKEANI_CDS_0117 [Acinetobacter phage vB_AbaM_Konradin-v2]